MLCERKRAEVAGGVMVGLGWGGWRGRVGWIFLIFWGVFVEKRWML